MRTGGRLFTLDFLFPAGLTAVSLLYLLGCTQIQFGTFSYPEEGFVPVIFGILLFAGSVWLTVTGYLQTKRSCRPSPVRGNSEVRDLGFLTAELWGYVLLLPILGFALSTFGILLGSAWIMGIKGRKAFLFAGTVTVTCYALFILILDIPFPKGIISEGLSDTIRKMI
jgi:hypothetical protein